MSKKLFENYKRGEGLTVGQLKKMLEGYPDDMKVISRLLNDNFPSEIVEEAEYNIYKLGGVIEATHKGILIR